MNEDDKITLTIHISGFFTIEFYFEYAYPLHIGIEH
jgi:hypothetical protein